MSNLRSTPPRGVRLSSVLTGLVVACVLAWLGAYLDMAIEFCKARLEAEDTGLPWSASLMLRPPLWAWIVAAFAALGLLIAKDYFLKPEWVTRVNTCILALLIVCCFTILRGALEPVQSLMDRLKDRPPH